ncbi:MAG: acyltransferase family protein, partial [Planctomycetota bacterium]|nr:acyltransferase family protein [Planctomycetota bacterium]
MDIGHTRTTPGPSTFTCVTAPLGDPAITEHDSPATAPGKAARHHDLDALRALAMLLGIALHGALSFVPIPWTVQDSQQHEMFGLLFFAIHGFRMPVFFVMSGFFTAMIWRRRGLVPLLG